MKTLTELLRTRWSSNDPADIFEVDNPSTGAVITRVQGSGLNEVDLAVRTAHAAFASDWKNRTGRERGALLMAVSAHLQAHAEEIAMLLARENGKPVRDALRGDLASLVGSFAYFGALAGKSSGEYVDMGFLGATTVRVPFGVVAGIIPFNWPPVHTGAKVAPALAAGNTIVLKPGEQAPLTILRIVDLINEVLPPDLVHCVTGAGAKVGEALTKHPLVRKISFTGAPTTGTAVLKAAAERHVPVLCELGGKNPFIVMKDADLDRAVGDAVDGAFFNKGEACTAASRMLVHQDVHDEFLQRLCAAVRKLRSGDGTASTTHVGPLVSRAQLEKVRSYIQVGVDEGAIVAAQGELPSEPELRNGYFVAPTVLAGVTDTMRVAQEEIFGPVTCVIRFRDEADAIRIANGTSFALVAAVYSRDHATASRVASEVEAGVVFINNYHRAMLGTAFGGTKASGYGREHSAETLKEFSYSKVIRTPTGRAPVPQWEVVREVIG